MAKAIALVRTVDIARIERRMLEIVRAALVGGCALALIAAGRALPF